MPSDGVANTVKRRRVAGRTTLTAGASHIGDTRHARRAAAKSNRRSGSEFFPRRMVAFDFLVVPAWRLSVVSESFAAIYCFAGITSVSVTEELLPWGEALTDRAAYCLPRTSQAKSPDWACFLGRKTTGCQP